MQTEFELQTDFVKGYSLNIIGASAETFKPLIEVHKPNGDRIGWIKENEVETLALNILESRGGTRKLMKKFDVIVVCLFIMAISLGMGYFVGLGKQRSLGERIIGPFGSELFIYPIGNDSVMVVRKGMEDSTGRWRTIYYGKREYLKKK